MPSCVINGCKNNSCFKNKSSGITFHKFPADVIWKENWIKVVRDNRNDDKWLPSKFSVICSVHFEEIDLYNAKGGYRRIKKNSTPKKIHLVNSKWCQEMEASGSSIHPKSPTLELVIKTEHCDIDEELDAAGILGNTSVRPTEDISKPQDYISNNQPEIDDFELESIGDTPEENKLRHEVKKHKLRNKVHARIIRTLNQKVKRLKKRNASLKRVLKERKDKKIKDTDVLNMLGENIVAAEICDIIIKKKKGKKKIKYSPAMKKFCRTLNSYSPKAYEYVRETFRTCLPHPKTLPKWNDHINGEPGTSQDNNAEEQLSLAN